MSQLDVLAVVSEIYPLIKTGGLADVAGALPGALKAQDVSVHTLVPGYPVMTKGLRKPETVLSFPALFGGPARVLATRKSGLDLFVLDAPHLYARPGGPYADAGGRDWPDNGQRFAALARTAASLGQGAAPAYRPAVVHAHDWQAGLVPAYLAYDGLPRPRTVMTVHNLAFQGRFPASLFAELGLPATSLSVDGVEYFDGVGFLKAGVRHADRITTVSPTYAQEICTPEWGMGLDGLLRGRSDVLSGILNGIDAEVWDPATDTCLTAPFSPGDVSARAVNKAAIQKRFGLKVDPDAPLLAVISRLTWQKGLDLLLAALPAATALGAQVAILGTGDRGLEAGWLAAAKAQPGQVGCVIGYEETLAHLIQGGADCIVVPSRFEPCGLTQLCALRYGAVPLVARVGGLADTVVDASPMALAAGSATGVQFAPTTVTALQAALRRTIALFHDTPAWRTTQANGMAADVSWREPARLYAELYRSLIKPAKARRP